MLPSKGGYSTDSLGGGRKDMTDGFLADIYVLADDRSAYFINSFLNEFLPEREPACDDWFIPEYSDEPELIITSVDELLSYCETHSKVTQRSYWNNTQEKGEPRSAHVFYLSEGKIILGLSTDDESLEQPLLESLKAFARTDLGYITYECPPEDTVGEFTRMAQATQQ